jgi:c-di-GMP-binding flagellar brake protein YcgR
VPTARTWEHILGVRQSSETWSERGLIDARRAPRFKLETDIRIYARNQAVAHGHTVDISESGIGAMLMDEIHLNEVVRLEFSLPSGEVEVMAVVRQRNAFRYGFEFIENSPGRERVTRTCRELAMEQSLRHSSIM